jgi:hypothetical protein
MVDIVLQQLPAYLPLVALWHERNKIIPPLHDHGISQDVIIHLSMVLMWRTSFKN